MTRRHTTRLPRTAAAAPAASPAARLACAAFGLVAQPSGKPTRQPAITGQQAASDDRLLRRALRGQVVLITGPSGSGKSQALDRARTLAPRPIIIADIDRIPPDCCAFDAVGRRSEAALKALAAAGLAEPALWARPASDLSVGERARLALARAIAAAAPGDIVLCDEFASNLDRASAHALARTASRWARRSGITLLAASAHEDLPAMLDADTVLEATPKGLRDATHDPRPPHTDSLEIAPGTIDDYHALARYHYLGARPATCVRILRATRTTAHTSVLAGVLVVSMPTFNGVWRRQAWPGRYDTPDKRANARRINRELRCISRVIVDPRSRGLGVASALVRAYLADPMTPATEAVAAMGGVSPFFVRAGMTEYRLPRPPHDARLHDALDHARTPIESLANPRTLRSAFLRRELHRWATDARVRIDHPDPLPHIARHALCRLSSTPRAYAHTRGEHDAGEPAH